MTTTDFLTQLAATALPYVLAILTALFAWGSAASVRLINARIKNETARGALERLQAEVATAVAEVGQTTVAALKAAAADGKLTKDEANEALETALQKAKGYLGIEGIAALKRALGPVDVDAYLVAKIEEAVAGVKVSP